MGDIFLKLLNMSITAGWLILVVLCVRLLFRRMPKWINCLLWGVVAVRLLIPFSIESVYSLQPSAEPIKTNTVVEGDIVPYVPSIDSNFAIVENTVNPILADTFAYEASESVAPLQVITEVTGYIWLGGMIALFCFAVGSVVRLRLSVRESLHYKENVYICDTVKSPFILGVIKPRIYTSSALGEEEMKHILAHENAHLKRRDHLWKPLGYLLLCVYWFNPLCWIAYILLCKDIELACDEKVIKAMDFGDKKEYSRVLLSCATQRRLVSVCPLAFGEVGVKERVKSVLNYKKPAFWITMVAIVVGIVVAVCFLTNPLSEDEQVADHEPIEEESDEPSEEKRDEPMDGKDAGFTGEKDDEPTSGNSNENSQEAPELITEEINVEKRDITHDGVADYIVTSMSYNPAYVDVNATLQDRIAQHIRYDVILVSVYDGKDSSGTYREENLLWSRGFSEAHVGNGQLSIAQWDGQEYLLMSNLWGGQGMAGWDYEVFSLNKSGEKQVLDQQFVEFEMDRGNLVEFYGNFQHSLEQYITDGILIVACDIDMEQQLIRTPDCLYIPQNYYTHAFSKYDYEEVPTENEYAGFPVNDLQNVTMKMEKYKSWEGEILIDNQSGSKLVTEEWYCIQKLENGEWHRMSELIDGTWKQVGYAIQDGETAIFQINWKTWYGELSPGKYRIVKEVSPSLSDSLEPHYLAAEFEIK